MVRNPWARLVSLYRHLQCTSETVPPFTIWLKTVAPNGSGGGGGSWQKWRRYGGWSTSHFIAGPKGEPLVDRVIRLEDVDRDLIPFLKTLDLPGIEEQSVPHANAREATDYRRWYDDDSAAWVRDRYNDDIERWNYTF